MKSCLTQAFIDVHLQVTENPDIDSHNSGSTLTCVIIEQEQLYCANVGDSRAILIWDNKKKLNEDRSSSSSNITILTANHQPDIPKEKIRINRAKGDVRPAKSNGNGLNENSTINRVYFKGKEGPGLAMSRSIGDTDAHTIGVIEKPGNN